MRRSLPLAALLAALLALGACDRNVEPYDPDEEVRQPDLSKIFPEGAERAAEQEGGPGMAGGGPPGAPPGRPPGGPAPPPGASRAGADAGADAPPVEGTVRLAPELEGRVPAGGILFLIARGEGGGPPVAVRRVTRPSFPMSFSLGPGDRMIEGMPFAGPFRVTARVDADGNAMTRNPGDLRGEAEGLHPPGASGVAIVIDEVL